MVFSEHKSHNSNKGYNLGSYSKKGFSFEYFVEGDSDDKIKDYLDYFKIGYNFHKNLYIANEFSPCGNKLKCKHCEECLNKIKIKQFIKEIENQV